MSIVRLTSLPGNTYFRLGPPPYLEADIAVPVTVQSRFWPQIIDNPVAISGAAIGDVGSAQYIWYRSDVDPAKVATGETVFFARGIFLAYAEAIENSILTINVRIATDNAFQARLHVLGTGGFNEFDFFSGNISQNTNEATPPYNWQKVYNFTREIRIANPLNLELEIKAVNYAQPGGNQLSNPAGLSYSIEIASLPSNDIFKIEFSPPFISNPLV